MGQELQGDEAVECGVLGLINDSHSTLANLREDFVVGYGFTDHSVWRINDREFQKISEKDLTVKDFKQPRRIDRSMKKKKAHNQNHLFKAHESINSSQRA